MVNVDKDADGNYKSLDYTSLFPIQQPLYLEIGSGKGEFLSAYSRLHPECNLLGIESADKRINNTLKKLNPEQHANVRLMRLFVDSSISRIFAPESISGVFIQHPDPWPKRKHHRRRLIQEEFLNALAHILKPEAQVQVSTDHSGYAAWILEEFLANPCYESVFDDPLRMQSTFEDHITTWFESEQRKQGYDPQFMLFKRI
jgi:tRNA (guanine-N7-)-methyltransferase